MELVDSKEELPTDGSDKPSLVPKTSCYDDGDRSNNEDHTKCFLEEKMEAVHSWLSEHQEEILLINKLLFTTGFLALVVAACVVNFSQGCVLLVVTCIVGFFKLWDSGVKRYGPRLSEKLSAGWKIGKKTKLWLKRAEWGSRSLPILITVVFNTAVHGPQTLVSFAGLLLLLGLMLIFSKHPFRWNWKTIISGMNLQFLFAVLVLKTPAGKNVLKWVGDKAEIFMSFSDSGAEFVFGPNYADHLFAFKVMPILVFMSSVISILQHVGFLSWLIRKIGFIMQHMMGTSPAESMAAAGNVFLGQAESVLLIRPYVHKLTCSEIHAVMTGGFASIAGSVLGSYIAFGVDPAHLLTASVMSAPASLAVAKAFWPETEAPQFSNEDIEIDQGNSSGVLEAVCQGAAAAVEVVANIVVTIISFLALLALVDSMLSWVGGIFGCPEFSFTLVCSYVFMPLSFLLGVPWEDSFLVADLIGKKTFINEFVAYQKLSGLIAKRKAGGPEYVGVVKQYLSERSETIATYALCGFSNVSSLGMLIGAMAAMAPERQADVSRCGLRSLIAGSVSCFTTACIAGILYAPDVHCPDFLSTAFNQTVINNSSQLLTCCTQLYDSVTWLQGNTTLAQGFSLSSLRSCCELSPRFNCSL